ncbi:bifunctional adenosylcobinamide kinase/adenosylcobinamide-phosphate guanylyltransferase [Calothrix sp. 336/3]|uniref:bifunctional adenosylcobinamide kinase/adenosylcobinamide-phosphate guanylyltransferase n=1 Tax=Calothrix sp. 336/3 TaxID=1337936 RepID=UPI0004E2D3F5|nr:bifunctional adenosylcobinamide kinase/adenosylcobinamide-phosphate guanylyltransferase [Calothrix sp. 336/3]
MNQSKVILVTGSTRSGKSEWAETLALESQKQVVYIATATRNPNDGEWEKRIQQHQQRRPENWIIEEVPIHLSATLNNAQANNCLLVDSLGTWVANLLEEDEESWQGIVSELFETINSVSAEIIFVAEETGWGVVPAYEMGRKFRDRLGSLIRYLGEMCDSVYLVTGGHVLNLSLLGSPLTAKK